MRQGPAPQDQVALHYTPRQIYNRVLTSTLSDGSNQVTLVSNTYDGCNPGDVTGLREHDTANYGTSFNLRGNLMVRVTTGATQMFGMMPTGT